MGDEVASKRVSILAALEFFYGDDESQPRLWREFFARNDVGLPLCDLVNQGMATPTDAGREAIDQTWEDLCKLLGIDPNPHTMYQTFQQMMELSEDDD